MKNQNVVVHFNESAYFTEVRKAHELLPQFQILIDEFEKLKLFSLDNVSQIKSLVSDGSKYIQNQLAQMMDAEKPIFRGFKMKASKIVEYLDLPDLSEIDSLCFALNKHDYFIDRYYNYNGSKISIHKDAMENLRERYSLIATTSAQQRLYACQLAAAKALNELSDALADASGFYLSIEEKYNNMFYLNQDKDIALRPGWYETNWPTIKRHEDKTS